MSNPEVLELEYLGTRSYLQGTTLFDALGTYCTNGTDISLRIPRLIQSDRIAVERFDPGKDEAHRFSATLVWNDGSAAKGLGVIPVQPSMIPRRSPFDEAAIVARAEFEDAVVTTGDQANESFARNVVALNKALLLRMMQAPQPGQWLFVRLELCRYFETFRQLRLKHRSNVGFAAVCSTIEVDGQEAGTVMFSWLRK